MSVATEITRLQGLKTRLRTKLVSMLGISSSAALADCVTAVEGIQERGAVAKTLDATTSNQQYTVPDGYHNGSGKVQIVLEEKRITANGTYNATAGKVMSKVVVDVDDTPTLQEKTVTPSEVIQEITPDAGYDGLSKVNVEAIPDNYADVSGVTLTADKALSGAVFVAATGEETAGTMPNNGAPTATFNGTTVTSYSIAAGYYSGGSVALDSTIETALAAI